MSIQIDNRGNFFLNKIVNVLYGTHYTDLCYGYNTFRRECLEVIDPSGDSRKFDGDSMQWGDGFEVETLINVRIAKAGLRVAEVPSFERSRYYGASNLNAFSDGVRVLRTIHLERRRGARRASVLAANCPQDAGKSWSVLSTLAEEAS